MNRILELLPLTHQTKPRFLAIEFSMTLLLLNDIPFDSFGGPFRSVPRNFTNFNYFRAYFCLFAFVYFWIWCGADFFFLLIGKTSFVYLCVVKRVQKKRARVCFSSLLSKIILCRLDSGVIVASNFMICLNKKEGEEDERIVFGNLLCS